jgi:carboxypeptidase Taq
MNAYRSLEQKFARLAAVQDALGILRWDTEAIMPKQAMRSRSQAIATLRGIAHDLVANAETADLLAAADAESALLDRWQAGNLREMHRIHRRESAVPRDLVEASQKAVLEATAAWREAREKDQFALLAAPLARVVELQRAIGETRGEQAGLSAYDSLLDGFDPGLRRATIDPIFSVLAADLPGLIVEATSRQARQPALLPLGGPFPAPTQRRLAEELMRTIGFDFERGRLDESTQPFCGGATDDVRVTARYDEGDFLNTLTALYHECGHALYEQGLPREFLGQPVGRARGLTVHESQALLMELQACATREFISYVAPLARAAFGEMSAAWDADNIYRSVNHVRPSFIRMDADEMTYVLHAVVRYQLETAMIDGNLPVADLPTAYNEAIRQTFGLEVPDDRMGCLQDIHWSAGLWGYFPSYALGAIVAAQLFDAACRARPEIRSALSQGDFAPLREWLRSNIHGRASLLQTDELIAAATGRPLETATYTGYLRARYVEAG